MLVLVTNALFTIHYRYCTRLVTVVIAAVLCFNAPFPSCLLRNPGSIGSTLTADLFKDLNLCKEIIVRKPEKAVHEIRDHLGCLGSSL